MKKMKCFHAKLWIPVMVIALALAFSGQNQAYATEQNQAYATEQNQAYATEPNQTTGTEQGSITIRLADLGTPRSMVGFDVYQAGRWNGEGNWVLDETLLDSGVQPEKLTYADDWDTAARILSQNQNLHNLKKASGQTDSSGIWKIERLDFGLYLIVQESGEDYGTVAPFLVSIPCVENGIQRCDLTIEPKAEVPEEEKTNPTPEEVDAAPQSPAKEDNAEASVTSAVKTGDQTPIYLYVGILTVALLMVMILFGFNHRKGRNQNE